ncbi:hypothetical protein [Oceanospirillum maris]|uniref:hypothetical protein n=1 Tax=Oceanospirillum maris TaxID=64977 RepID=UPI000425B689|nr:hypothetical protein [Oceanospirillum maris]
MLSRKTVALLNEACQKSDELYDQGGLIYLYSFGHRRAHSFINPQLLKSAGYPKPLSDPEFDQLKTLFANALCQYGSEPVSDQVAHYVQKFIDRLNVDFSGMYSCISESADDGLSHMIELTFIENNDFHTLELFWSVD